MFLPVANNYELIVEDFKEKGAQVAMKKRKGMQPVIPVTLIAVLFFAYLNESLTGNKVYMSLSVLCIIMIIVVSFICSIHTETLLIIASIGITVRRSNLFGTSSKFYNIQEIQDVVIIEAVTMYKVVFQLVLLPKNGGCNDQLVSSHNTDNDTKRLHPLFQSFQPKLKDLQIVYRHIQEKLFHSHEKDR